MAPCPGPQSVAVPHIDELTHLRIEEANTLRLMGVNLRFLTLLDPDSRLFRETVEENRELTRSLAIVRARIAALLRA